MTVIFVFHFYICQCSENWRNQILSITDATKTVQLKTAKGKLLSWQYHVTYTRSTT